MFIPVTVCEGCNRGAALSSRGRHQPAGTITLKGFSCVHIDRWLYVQRMSGTCKVLGAYHDRAVAATRALEVDAGIRLIDTGPRQIWVVYESS